jgi:arginine decarboxylase
VATTDILAFMSALDTREIHGYLPEYGYRVFTEDALRATGAQDASGRDDSAQLPGG